MGRKEDLVLELSDDGPGRVVVLLGPVEGGLGVLEQGTGLLQLPLQDLDLGLVRLGREPVGVQLSQLPLQLVLVAHQLRPLVVLRLQLGLQGCD